MYLLVECSSSQGRSGAVEGWLRAILLQSVPRSEVGVQCGAEPLAECTMLVPDLVWRKLLDRLLYMRVLVGTPQPCIRQMVFARRRPPESVLAGDAGVWFDEEQVLSRLDEGLPQLLYAHRARAYERGPTAGWWFIPFVPQTNGRHEPD